MLRTIWLSVFYLLYIPPFFDMMTMDWIELDGIGIGLDMGLYLGLRFGFGLGFGFGFEM